MKKTLDEINKRTNQRSAQTTRRMQRYYQRALDNIRGDMAKHDAKGVFDIASMRKYNRLDNMTKQIDKHMGALSGSQVNSIKSMNKEVYKESYGLHNFGVSKDLNVDVNFGVIDDKAVEAAVNNPLVQGSWQESSRLSVNQAKRKVKQNITTGLIQGKGYDQISRQVSKDMEMGLNRANRIVRTESHRAREQGKYDSMKEGEELGVKQKKRWLATLDDATRDSHQDLDGVTIDVDKDFEGEDGKGPAPGQLGSAREDINCRCTLLTIVEDYEPEERRSRDEGMGKYEDYDDYAQKKMDQKHNPIDEKEKFYQDLEEKESRIVGQDYETAHVYDENDNYLFEKDGNRDSVGFTSQEVTQMHGGTLSHNHPSGDSFSREDVKFARTLRLKEMRAVDNNYLHAVKPKNGSWERSMGVFKGSDGVERNFIEVINNVHEDVRRDFTELIQNGDMLVSTAEREHFHELWTRVQRETDAIEYSRVRR